jgi:hypothetical protein
MILSLMAHCKWKVNLISEVPQRCRVDRIDSKGRGRVRRHGRRVDSEKKAVALYGT